MSVISTPVTELFGIKHPILLAGAFRPVYCFVRIPGIHNETKQFHLHSFSLFWHKLINASPLKSQV